MPASNEPLGLPPGSVRGLVTLILVVAVCALCLLRQPVPEILQQGFLLAIGMYHLSRTKSGQAVAVPFEEDAPL